MHFIKFKVNFILTDIKKENHWLIKRSNALGKSEWFQDSRHRIQHLFPPGPYMAQHEYDKKNWGKKQNLNQI